MQMRQSSETLIRQINKLPRCLSVLEIPHVYQAYTYRHGKIQYTPWRDKYTWLGRVRDLICKDISSDLRVIRGFMVLFVLSDLSIFSIDIRTRCVITRGIVSAAYSP